MIGLLSDKNTKDSPEWWNRGNFGPYRMTVNMQLLGVICHYIDVFLQDLPLNLSLAWLLQILVQCSVSFEQQPGPNFHRSLVGCFINKLREDDFWVDPLNGICKIYFLSKKLLLKTSGFGWGRSVLRRCCCKIVFYTSPKHSGTHCASDIH